MRRRQWLKAGGATLAAPLLTSVLRPLDALAQTKQIVVMTWGGQWGDAMRDNVDAAFEKATGIKVVQGSRRQPGGAHHQAQGEPTQSGCRPVPAR